MASAQQSYQPFISYLKNKNTTPELHFEDLDVRDEVVVLELRYDGDLAPRDEQDQVREVIPEYFLMACRKGVFENMKGIIRCSENSDYLLFAFEKEWVERMESQKDQPNWDELKSQILNQVSHSYGEEPEV
jgi:hypothetical protein